MRLSPTTLSADRHGRIVDIPGLLAAARTGRTVVPIDPSLLIPLPRGSTLYLLPGRTAVGYDTAGGPLQSLDSTAVAAFLPPGYTAAALAAFDRQPSAPMLPLFCYCAVCWYRGRFHVPAVRVDTDPKHDGCDITPAKLRSLVKQRLGKHPGNRLLAHHGLVCALQYTCPNAVNLFLGRWEAPVAVAGACNAACHGCISKRNTAAINPPQERIGFTPTVDEIVDLAVPHLKRAPRAMISFGQGCEGEPLLRWKLIEEAIRAIRRETARGTLHVNTNGSKPEAIGRLAAAGLDSIRISLNSARKDLYEAYYGCRRCSYSFDDVLEGFHAARKAGLWVSVNYLTFPGVTDDMREHAAFARLLAAAKPDMIQWRNLNIDPDFYMKIVETAVPAGRTSCMGISALIESLRRQFPSMRMGYFNPPVRSSGR